MIILTIQISLSWKQDDSAYGVTEGTLNLGHIQIENYRHNYNYYIIHIGCFTSNDQPHNI